MSDQFEDLKKKAFNAAKKSGHRLEDFQIFRVKDRMIGTSLCTACRGYVEISTKPPTINVDSLASTCR
jgi:hypothetical protein